MPEPYRLSDVLVAEFEAIKDDGSPRRITVQDRYGALTGLRQAVDDAGRSLQGEEQEREKRREIYNRAHSLDLTALCLSGGGIRSATFALGVIQGLADKNLLQKFDYLSTVSGGGYIGSWLSAWLHDDTSENVLKALQERRADPEKEPAPIQHLRQYSAYLTPKSGLLSGDLWAPIAIVIRNLVLNWLILLPVIAGLMIAVKTIGALVHSAQLVCEPFVYLGAVLSLFLGGVSFRYKLWHLYADRPANAPSDEDSRFLRGSLVPALAAGFGFTWLTDRVSLPAKMGDAVHGAWTLYGYVSMAAVAVLVYLLVWATLGSGAPKRWADRIGWVVSALVWGSLIWLGIFLYSKLGDASAVPLGSLCVKITDGCTTSSVVQPIVIDRQLLLVIFGMPWCLMSILLAQIVYAMVASYSPDGDFEREWLGRAGGWYLLAGLGWVVTAAIILLGPALFYHWQATTTAFGIVSGAVTAIIGKSSFTPAAGSAKGWPSITSNVALAVAGPVFAAVLLILMSALFDRVALGAHFEASDFFTGSGDHYGSNWIWTAGVAAVLAAIAFTGDLLVNVNRFSLHAVYRNRLIRAYLGARQYAGRVVDGFTGFAQKDNLRLASIWEDRPRHGRPWRPYHILNMTLNLAATKNLAWQQRKAMSFIASPKYCGAADLGYRPTAEYGDPGGGMTLGTAMAISGAAVSSNMGYHTSPSLSFLLTLFNVRLGWWLGNPGPAGDLPPGGGEMKRLLSTTGRPVAPYTQDAPWFSIPPLLSELLARTNEDSAYVNLSDGGHFEDLGLYEMVRRRCKLIIVSDGDQDPNHGFEDLGNAVRKIWIDLGIRISFTKSALLQVDKDTKPAQMAYYAIGTIEYVSDVAIGGSAPTGSILYIKPAVRGDEAAADIIAYKRANEAFPHQTTADQWFDEPQIESYRALGYLTVSRIIEAAGMDDPQTLEALFEKLPSIDAVTMTAAKQEDEDT